MKPLKLIRSCGGIPVSAPYTAARPGQRGPDPEKYKVMHMKIRLLTQHRNAHALAVMRPVKGNASLLLAQHIAAAEIIGIRDISRRLLQ